MTDLVDSGGWVPLLDTTNEGPVTCDAATQTEGIFYPSSRTINKAMAATEAVIAWTNVKKPSGTYSPGRGNGLISGLCMIGAGPWSTLIHISLWPFSGEFLL